MNLHAFSRLLVENPDAALHWMLPDGDMIPAHYHVTEVGRVHKAFVDCGGTMRESTACVLQIWVADDVEHRLNAGKLAKILQLAESLLKGADLPLEVEFQTERISQYPVTDVEITPRGLLFHLDGKATACLAPDRCGVGEAGCC